MVMISRGRNPGSETISGSPQSRIRSRNTWSLERPQVNGRLDLVQAVERRLQSVVETTGPGCLFDLLDIPAGRAIVHPIFEVESLGVQHRIAVIHHGTVIVEMGRHGLLLLSCLP